MSNEQKDKKIADLRSLLTQAKSKIEEYKAQLISKEKQIDELKRQYDKKIKLLEGDSENIIKQYEERLLRYQKTIEESDRQIDSHKKNLINSNKNYEEMLKKIANLYNLAAKVFAVTAKEKDNSDAVEELCEIEKCKEFSESLERYGESTDVQGLTKMLSLLTKNSLMNLNKRRDQRIQFVKRETMLQKAVEEQKNRSKHLQSEIDSLKQQLSDVRTKHQRQIEAMAANKQKIQEQKTNEQFVKQLLMKLILGPKDASIMAFGILAKVLKMNEEEMKQCEKKIK